MRVQNFNRAKYNQLRRDATALRLPLTPTEKLDLDIRNLRRAVAALEPMRSPFVPEIGQRIETLLAEIATLENQLSTAVVAA